MKTIDYCISILSNHIYGKKSNAPKDSIRWDKLIKYFKCHELTGILYYQCKDYIPDEFRKKLEEQYASLVYYYNNRVWMEKKLFEMLDENHINGFTIKGLEVAKYYPVPSLRTMGDTDIVVKPEDREKVHELLLSRGYVSHSKLADREWQYFYNNMEVELHDRLIYQELTNDKLCDDFFNGFNKYVSDGTLDLNFHFLFLIYHIRKHFMNRGVGFRHFYDIAVLTKNNGELNWQWIKEKLIELNMWEFAQRILFLNKYWFGINPPLDIKSFDKAFSHDATKYIFENGVFGFDNQKNNSMHAINSIRKKQKHNYGIRRMNNLLFPSYKIMCQSNDYAFLKNRRYLLPVAWMYRFARAIKYKKAKKNMRLTIETSFVSKKSIQERAEVLKEWGLE